MSTARFGVLIDNAVYKQEVPGGYEVLRDDKNNQPMTKLIKDTSKEDSEEGVTYTACYPKAVGRFSISPAMVVVLSTLMSNTFEENFLNIGDVFAREMAKFLYLTVQVFHGRPVRELVDFIVGPLTLIGETAQEILKGDTQVAFRSLTLRVAGSQAAGCGAQGREKRGQRKNHGNAGDGVRRRQDDRATEDTTKAKRDVVSSAPQDAAGLWSTKSGGHAWIEISPPNLPSAGVVLHIPNVITLPFQCKDRFKPLPYREVAKAMNSMLVESKQWRDPDPTKERSHSQTRPVKSCSDMIKDLDKVFQNQAGATPAANLLANFRKTLRVVVPNAKLATLNSFPNTAKNTPQNNKKIDYGQKLCDLGAPVIPILYVSQAGTLSSESMSWDLLHAIGPHCIMAEGIGEHSLEAPALFSTNARRHASLPTQDDTKYIIERQHRVRKTIMLFEVRHKVATNVVHLAVTTAPLAATKVGRYTEQCTPISEELRNHCSGASKVKAAKDRIRSNLKREEREWNERVALVDELEAIVRGISEGESLPTGGAEGDDQSALGMKEEVMRNLKLRLHQAKEEIVTRLTVGIAQGERSALPADPVAAATAVSGGPVTPASKAWTSLVVGGRALIDILRAHIFSQLASFF